MKKESIFILLFLLTISIFVSFAFLFPAIEDGQDVLQVQDGTFTTYYETGHLLSQTDYQKGFRHGKEVYYHPNGNVSRSIYYENDLKNGEELTYYQNGLLKSRLYYKNGLKEGEAKTFYNDNDFSRKEPKLQAVVIFENGKAVSGYCFNVINQQKITFNKAHLHNFELDMSTPCDILRKKKIEEEQDK